MSEREIGALLEEAARKKLECRNRELVALVAIKRTQTGLAVLSSRRGLNVEEREDALSIAKGAGRELARL